MRVASPEKFSELPLKPLLICCGASTTSGLQAPWKNAQGKDVSLLFWNPPQGNVNGVSLVWFAVSNAGVSEQLFLLLVSLRCWGPGRGPTCLLLALFSSSCLAPPCCPDVFASCLVSAASCLYVSFCRTAGLIRQSSCFLGFDCLLPAGRYSAWQLNQVSGSLPTSRFVCA